ncbi:PAS domain S-box protein [Natrialbaceae archaeon GCM10025810]|uniref:PAS domain S-box protein n=1 Tax=Halovalidus salilacus TaxID=3075124 RepID=UPI0036243E5A
MGTTDGSRSGTAVSAELAVLYVDDDPSFAAELERADERIETITAANATDGLERLSTADVDCVVSECDVGETDGLAFLEAVREIDSDLPFILFTDGGSEAIASRAISAGVTEYVTKGGGTEQWTALANSIVNAVERARARAQRRRHLRAIETAQEGISLLDADGRFTYVNRAYAGLFGYEPEELVGEHWEVLYPDDRVDVVREEVVPAVMADGEWHGETVAVKADGSRFLAEHSLSTANDGELVCTFRDVTDERARERAVERFETIVEALGDPVYTVDSEGRYSFVNDAYADLTGYDKEEIVGHPVSFLLDDASVERGADSVRKLLSSDASQVTYEITVETSDGRRVRCEDNVSLLPLEDGRYRGVAGVVRDITERTERERELERYETILKTIPDEVYSLDAEGYFTTVVPPTRGERSVTGYRPEELVGEHVSLVLADEDIETGEAVVRELWTDDDVERLSYEVAVITNDGERVPHETHIALLPSDDGRFRGSVGVLRDVTERKRRKRELERQNERLEAFASVVSHDLRNPLNVAQGRLELAIADLEASDRERGRGDDGEGDRRVGDPLEHLESVSWAHERMRALVDDILAVAREGEPVGEGEPVDLASLTRRCWAHVPTDGADLRLETDAVVRADESRLARLLENLMRNAVEHSSTSPRSGTREDAVEHASTGSEAGAAESGSRSEGVAESGSVTVTVGELPDGMGFYVEDTGPGIPEAVRERVFESGYSTSDEGTGFGLSIVGEIADAHGWTVTVADGTDGGARFEISDVVFEE